MPCTAFLLFLFSMTVSGFGSFIVGGVRNNLHTNLYSLQSSIPRLYLSIPGLYFGSVFQECVSVQGPCSRPVSQDSTFCGSVYEGCVLSNLGLCSPDKIPGLHPGIYLAYSVVIFQYNVVYSGPISYFRILLPDSVIESVPCNTAECYIVPVQ